MLKKSIFIIFSMVILTGMLIHIDAFSFGLGKVVNNSRPSICSNFEKLLNEHNGYYIGNDQKEVYLSFDCGYEAGYTDGILESLRETNTKAIFFITGHYLTSATDMVKKMVNDGHIVANHSYYHKDYSKINEEEMKYDLEKLENEYEELIGSKMPRYFRPPSGKINERALKYLSENGYTTMMWSLAYVDWYKDISKGKDYSYNNVMKKMHNGAIILMHTVNPDNTNALTDIINTLKEQGYTFKGFNELTLKIQPLDM